MPASLERSLEGSASGVVFTTGEPRIFSVRELEALSDSGYIRERGIRSVCSVPLATAHGILGTFDLGAFAEHAFSPDQFPLLTRIAGQIAIAVRNAMSYQRIEELNAQLAREKLYLEERFAAIISSRKSSAAAAPPGRAVPRWVQRASARWRG